ncbi:MAG: hypothetical protein ACFFC7_11650 [Candidatus Hermodarchaeota archaeon]
MPQWAFWKREKVVSKDIISVVQGVREHIDDLEGLKSKKLDEWYEEFFEDYLDEQIEKLQEGEIPKALSNRIENGIGVLLLLEQIKISLENFETEKVSYKDYNYDAGYAKLKQFHKSARERVPDLAEFEIFFERANKKYSSNLERVRGIIARALTLHSRKEQLRAQMKRS